MAVLKNEPAGVAVAVAEAAEAAAVTMGRSDNNQQRAEKTVAAGIEVGKRQQARGERQQRQQGQQGGSGGGGGGGSNGWWGEARDERVRFHGSYKKMTPKRRCEWRERNYIFFSASRYLRTPG